MSEIEVKDLFYFESDHLALKGNKDYSELLKTIAILEAQKTKAIKDVEKLIEIKNAALQNPLEFLDKLRNNQDLGIPGPQIPAVIPVINWANYNCLIPSEAFKLLNTERTSEKDAKVNFREPIVKAEVETHKKQWSSEEQKKLEELLVKFPPEAVEMRRYKKIADVLGNRTTRQVTSRVQKYFLKLHKAGLPIPGRIPKTNDRKKCYIHKHQKHNYYLYKPSTFFPELEVPVVMPENVDDYELMDQSSPQDDQSAPKNELQLKIELLRKVKIEKTRELQEPQFAHLTFKCDYCNDEPIRGARWHCFDCKHSIDFCTDCVITQLNSPNPHPLSHNLIPLRSDVQDGFLPPKVASPGADVKSEVNSDSESLSSDSNEETVDYDRDYGPDNFAKDVGKYNYLDPNFLHE